MSHDAAAETNTGEGVCDDAGGADAGEGARDDAEQADGEGSRGAYRWMLAALRFFALTHLLALPLLALWLQPGLDAGTPLIERARYVAEHALVWRLGWVSWQLCALSDVLLTAALLAWAYRRRRGAMGWALAALMLNVLAVVPEQWAELVLVTRYAEDARLALGDLALGNAAAFSRFEATERWALIMTGVCGNGGYVATTYAWYRALAAPAPETPRWFGRVTWLACGLFVVSSLALMAGLRGGINHTPFVALSSGPAFVLLIPWALLAAHTLACASGLPRPDDAALHEARWPDAHPLRWLGPVAGSRGLRDLLRVIPMMRMKSDIRDVVYLNWLVPSAQAQQLLPAPLRVHDLGGVTALSILTYRHGHFGPALAGPLRRLMPSPYQSNWRLYLDPPDAPTNGANSNGAHNTESGTHDTTNGAHNAANNEHDAIYFIKTIISSAPFALASRLLADGLPAQLSGAFEHRRDGARIETHIDPDGGQAAKLRAIAEEHDERTLPESWSGHFDDWHAAVRYLVEQNRAVAVDRPRQCVFESQIAIPIDIDTIRPASAELQRAPLIAPLIEGAEVLAFVVPAVPFEARGERTIALLQ